MSYPAIGSLWRNIKLGKVWEVTDAGGGEVEMRHSGRRTRFASDNDGNPIGFEPVSRDQPAPIRNDLPAVWPLVIADMQARDALGRARYGTPLQPANGRNALLDAYEEQLDGIAYTKQLLIEQEMLRRLVVEVRAAVNRGDCVFADDLLGRALELLPVGRVG